MNVRHLRAVAAIALGGSIGAASRIVNLTQPAITQGVAKLERQIGVPLFTRGPGGMIPTEAGHILASRTDAALRLMDARRATGAQIRAFLAVADAGGYSPASAASGTSEASLHRAVADLSLAIGHRLLERRGRGVMLTPRGVATARRFRLGAAELQSALAEIAGLQGRAIGRIAIGAMPLSRARVLPEAIAAFHARHPTAEIRIVEGSHAELAGSVRDGEIDLMVGALRDAPGNDLAQRALFVDRPVIVGRAGHPLLGRAITPGMLAEHGWIVPAIGTPLRSQWLAMFAAGGVAAPAVPIECGSVMMIRQLLLRSDYLTLLSADQVRVELQAGWLAIVADAPGAISRTIGVTTRADWRPTTLQARFLELLAEEAQSLPCLTG